MMSRNTQTARPLHARHLTAFFLPASIAPIGQTDRQLHLSARPTPR
jgi:hypothetical protein